MDLLSGLVRTVLNHLHSIVNQLFRSEDGIFLQSERPVSEVRAAAIAIANIAANQRHIGILHRGSSPNSPVKFLHLAFHFDLRNEDQISAKYVWVGPKVPEARLRQVAAKCRQIHRANGPNLPYAFSPPIDCIDAQTGQYLLGPTNHGLTCASFVLAVFERAGLRLVDYGSWQINRPGDMEWQTSILEVLRNGSSQQHIAALQAEIGAVRFRPEEVAGAAAVSPLPASFEAALEKAQLVMTALSKAN